jgi:hypothetical protein
MEVKRPDSAEITAEAIALRDRLTATFEAFVMERGPSRVAVLEALQNFHKTVALTIAKYAGLSRGTPEFVQLLDFVVERFAHAMTLEGATPVTKRASGVARSKGKRRR